MNENTLKYRTLKMYLYRNLPGLTGIGHNQCLPPLNTNCNHEKEEKFQEKRGKQTKNLSFNILCLMFSLSTCSVGDFVLVPMWGL